jgi:peptide/nickel transport system substrate-binding protein
VTSANTCVPVLDSLLMEQLVIASLTVNSALVTIMAEPSRRNGPSERLVLLGLNMSRRCMAFIIALSFIFTAHHVALAQKAGGTLRLFMPDSPASISPLEEGTVYAVGPMMGVFNNLVVFDQHVKRNSLHSIRPDLATAWSWNKDGTQLIFLLRQGVSWHDGKPFSAKDVECTWNLILEKSAAKLRANIRASAYSNLDRVTTNGDREVTFHLKRPQPAFLALLAGGHAPVYPCHVPPEVMRRQPVGTGPFKLVEFKPNQHIRLARNTSYWKADRPFLDGVEYVVIRSVATALLSFASGEIDMTFPTEVTLPLLRDVQKQTPSAVCELTPGTISRHIMFNHTVPPFNKAELRRAIALALDRQAFIDIVGEGRGLTGEALQPPPGGEWGLPLEQLKDLPGYGANLQKNRQQARAILETLGYGPTNRLKVKLTTRDLPQYRNPAVILLDQLKEIYVDAELETIETTAFFPKMRRKNFVIALNLQPSGPDPDPALESLYGCAGNGNWDGYCSPELDSRILQQSMEGNEERRKGIVWAILRTLAENAVRPVIFYPDGATCAHPYVKNVTLHTNSVFNSYRFEDVWLDK